MSAIERDELIARLIEADRALFDSGDTVSHRQSAETALRVVEDYIDQRLRGAVDPMLEYRLAGARGLAKAIAQCRNDARLDGIREGAAEILALLGGQ